MEDNFWIVSVVLVVVLGIGGLIYFFHQKNDCDARGGVLVRSMYTNLYECVSPLPPLP